MNTIKASAPREIYFALLGIVLPQHLFFAQVLWHHAYHEYDLAFARYLTGELMVKRVNKLKVGQKADTASRIVGISCAKVWKC